MSNKMESVPLATRVRRQIEGMIEAENLAGKRLIAYRRLAERLGVCQRTVQLVLAKMEAEGLIERRHGSGTYVLDAEQRRAHTAARSLLVVVRRRPDPSAGWDPVTAMLAGVRSQSEKAGVRFEMLAWEESEDSRRLLDGRETRAYAGFVLLRVADPRLVSRLMRRSAGPVVVVDEHPHGLPVISVTDDSLRGAEAVTRYLLRLGHRRIAYLDVADRQNWNPTKHHGYRMALEEAGLPVDESLIVAPPLGVPALSPQASNLVDGAVGELLALPTPPTAIFAYDDRRAVMVMDSLRRRGLVPGRDVCVAGFGDTAFRTGSCHGLTSCRIDFVRLGREAVRAIVRPANPQEGRFIVVPDRLMIRESTGAAPDKVRSCVTR